MKIFKSLLGASLFLVLMLSFLLSPSSAYVQGDMNSDNEVTLNDAVLIMKLLAKMSLDSPLPKQAGVGSDQKIGLDDLVYVLQVVSQLRSKNTSPTASFSFPVNTGEAPFLVEFDASASSDPEGQIVDYLWNFGDGEIGSGQEVSHTYYTPGTYLCTLTVVDAGGARGVFTQWIAVTGQSEPSPDPAEVAPELDMTVATDLKTATEFLYTGINPIQEGVIPDKIEAKRVAVLRGQVMQRCKDEDVLCALAGVRIRVLDHPEFGRTLTRDDGLFDLAVNGGGKLTVDYQKTGFLPAQRQVDAPWQDFAWLPDVVLVPVDDEVTEVSLGAAEVQVARGSEVTDGDGLRRATLLVPPGTIGALVMPDGSKQSIGTMNVRATEYTVGPHGPQAMPAELPPNVGYTYALEYTVDEAVAAGAVSVTFDSPVYHYVENFLGFPVGQAVPTGYYDRQQGAWVPSRNGRVIAVLSVVGGLAVLDTDGDGLADDPATLADLGVTNTEREQIAALYGPGQTLWRVPLTHFTPWDCNWPYGPPGGAGPPGGGQPGRRGGGEGEDDPCDKDGRCVIEFQGQVLGESLPIVGTPFTLNYRSNRTPGFTEANTLDIPLSGDTVPAPLKRIELAVEVAGRRYPVLIFPPDPNQNYVFTWDGRDAYGRTLQGLQQATVRVGYVYDAVYLPPAEFEEAFSRFSSGTVFEGIQARSETTLWQISKVTVGVWAARGPGLGGWALSVHHAYDPWDGSVHLGTGETRRVQALGAVITTYAGGGSFWQYNNLPVGGIPATDAYLMPWRMISGPDGSLYISNTERIFHVDPDGVLTLLAGTGYQGFSGDGGPATAAQFSWIGGLDLAPDGSIFVTDVRNNRVRRINPDGIVTTVAGNGDPGFAGDGGPATEAEVYSPVDVAVDPNGGFYIAQATYPRIRHVGADGIITTVAGGDPAVFWGEMNEGGLATQAYVMPPALAMGTDGILYFIDYTNRIRRITMDGIVTTVAGNGAPGFAGDGGPATEANIYTSSSLPSDLVVSADGSVYFNQSYYNRIRKIGPDGIITTIAGTGLAVYDGSDDGSLGLAAALASPRGVALAPDGSLFTAEYKRVRQLKPPSRKALMGDNLVPSSTGRQVYVFDHAGRHLESVHALTGAPLYTFGYDGRGLLRTVTDVSGNVTTVERDETGNPTAITALGGQRTILALDEDGYLTSLTTPSSASWGFTYDPGGLLSSISDPNENQQDFTYDEGGRLVRDDDPEGGYLQLSRELSPSGFEVTALSAEDRVSSFGVERLTDGSWRRTNTFTDGTRNIEESAPDGTRVITAGDGTMNTLRVGPDPRFGLLAPLAASYTETTPAGLSLTYNQTREVTLNRDGDLLRPLAVHTTQTLNSLRYTSLFSAAEGTITRTTPAGRQLVTSLDEQGRSVEFSFGNLYPIRLAYDPRGRLSVVRQGTGLEERAYTLTYDAGGFLSRLTDPLGRVTQYTVDGAGRITAITAPDGGQTALGYDNRGNLISVTPPEGLPHTLRYNRVHRLVAYDPPDVPGSTGASTLHYNLDRDLTSYTKLDGRTVALIYDDGGRLVATSLERGDVSFDYGGGSCCLTRVLYPGGEVSYAYDGSLITGISWSGTVAGQVDRTFDDFFRVASVSVEEGDSVVFTYDDDGLLTAAGDLTIARDPATGLITGTTLNTVTDAWLYNGFGELTGYVSAPGEETWELVHTRDLLGRIVETRETRETSIDIFGYAYDPAGRLVEVNSNGDVVIACEYNTNGNRTAYTGPDGVRVTAAYDAQDRLVSFGPIDYTYRADGSLQSRTDGAGTTNYAYDELGNLVSVTLPGGDQIDYVIDGRNRRIGKIVNGDLVQGFLYQDQLRPVAELDGAGAVVSQFVYGTRANVPDYLVRDGVSYRILSDHLGSPRFVVDTTTGEVVQRLVYDAFGRVEQDTNPGFQPFGLAGGLYDPDTGLVRFGARDYAPEAGRWTAPDPALFLGGTANLYAYAGNDPVNRTDPTGLLDDPCERPQSDCDEEYRSEGRDIEWRRRRTIEIPYWLDSVIGWVGAVSSTAGSYSTMAGSALVSGAGSVLGVIAWPVAFEGAMQTGDQMAERLVDQRVERDMAAIDELWRETNREQRRTDNCP